MPDKEADKETSGPPPDQTLFGGGISSSSVVAFGELTVRYSYAPEWFEDALHEAKTGTNHNARRREIVFAVCCAESYIFEWVRDRLLDQMDLKTSKETLSKYFPSDPRRRQGVLDRWKDVPKKLKNDGFIQAVPNLSRTYWRDFRQLVFMRNGLVHALASRPETAQQPQEESPLPSKRDLDQLPPGRATKVVVELIENLHRAVGTFPPSWLVMP